MERIMVITKKVVTKKCVIWKIPSSVHGLRLVTSDASLLFVSVVSVGGKHIHMDFRFKNAIDKTVL